MDSLLKNRPKTRPLYFLHLSAMGPAASLEVDRESLVRSVVRDERVRVHRPRDRERRQRCGGRAAPGRHEAEQRPGRERRDAAATAATTLQCS